MKKDVIYKKFILLFVSWIAFAFLFALQGYVSSIYLGQSSSFELLLAIWLISSCGWLILTPVVLHFSKKFTIKRGQIFQNLVIHLAAAIILAVVHLSIIVVFRQMLLGNPTETFVFSKTFQRLFLSNFNFDFLIYWILVGGWHLWNINRRYIMRERETSRLALQTSQLETKLAQSQLDALKMQLHPHFLFNALNSISVLMYDDVKSANQMLINLSELLRIALRSENTQEVCLKDELEFLHRYLEIEQVRFESRLNMEFAIDDETLNAKVPSLVLQPLVENAIRHGIAPLAGKGKIFIESRRENNFVEIIVSDNGAGIGNSLTKSHGIGLRNTRERLEKLYGKEHQFEAGSSVNGGFCVKIRIPYHEK